MNSVSDHVYWHWLASSAGNNLSVVAGLLSQELTLAQLFDNIKEIDLVTCGVSKTYGAKLIKRAHRELLEEELHRYQKLGIHPVSITDKEYPQNLKEIPDAPVALYVKGKLSRCTKRMVSVIGTRHPTRENEQRVRELSKELAQSGVTVISGMARGLDSAAQRGALDGGGVTVAVLGCGCDVIYPQENVKLYEEICEKGAVVSECLPGTPPRGFLFPRRNRIISGMGRALVVGQGKVKSGGSITVKMAKEQSRDIFTVMPDKYDPENDLPSSLIECGIPVVMNVNTILHAYGWGLQFKEKEEPTDLGLDFLEEELYNLLLKDEKSADELAEAVSKPAFQVALSLTTLELKGLIVRLPGGRFGRNYK